jgi:tRNA nucleotidyltransferase (CCA-adding enzyme)
VDLILCHTTADFDTLGAAVGLSRLLPGARIVLTGGCHPTVREFLALHRDEYPLIERRSVNPRFIQSISVVDTQWRDRLGKAEEWLDLPDIEIRVYDHHLDAEGDVPATWKQIEPVGATATLMVEQLQRAGIVPNPVEATVMALGIHVDTGSLTFDHTTVRDAAALTWLMEQGANVRSIAEYIEPGLSPQLQDLLTATLDELQSEEVEGLAIAWAVLRSDGYVPGLSGLTSRLMDLTESDIFLLAVYYTVGDVGNYRLNLIGRLRGGSSVAPQLEQMNLGDLFAEVGGGGHAKAAAATLRTTEPEAVVQQVIQRIRQEVPHPPTARELMSSPVRTIRPDTSIAEAQRILLRYGHSGLSVVDHHGKLVGIISRRDIDIALHHGFSHAPVKGYMTPNLKTITPDTPLSEIESLMVTYDIGRLPVLDQGALVGIVTRTDVLRQVHQAKLNGNGNRLPEGETSPTWCNLPGQMSTRMLQQRLVGPLWQVLQVAQAAAEARGWHLYLVGGAVRDLLLTEAGNPQLIEDVDLVVDGFHQAADQGAGVELAKVLRDRYPDTRLQVHGRFQTAALLWHHDPHLKSLWVDIATARTEFYPYPAANPEVEASSIRQDLYRRDFTINALAIRLTQPRQGELLDFFGGLEDLRSRQIRVLHANSFIEDPTRIFRAVRFAVRLGFHLEARTEEYIRHAIASGIYHRIRTEMERTPSLQTRLKRELKYILEAPYWKPAVRLLADLGALRCLDVDLELSDRLWRQMRLVDRWLKRFDPEQNLPHWQMLLEVLLAEIAPEPRRAVAETLQLPADSIERLAHLEALQAEIEEQLPKCDRPSQIVQFLHQFDLDMLTLLVIRLERPLRRQIWHYLTHLSQIHAPLNGKDLKAMGYKPGKLYKQILDALLAATLDGEVSTDEDARVFVIQNFPKPG